MSAAEPSPSPSPATTDEDLVGDRTRLLRIGMAAVFAACVVFAILRFVVEWQTGKLTPWWGNAIGAVGIGALYLWVRGDTARRSSVAVHGTALLATIALLAPAAYGMASSKWWLALVGFSVTLMGRRREVLVWAGITIVLIPTVALLEPSIQMPNAAGEPAAERAFAGAMFIVLLLAITAAFRRVADQRARDLVETAARLERAVATRSRFLANMSHEIRNPLHGVIAMTDLALTGEASETVRRQIEAAQQSARALLNILNNILDVSRAEADALEIEARPFDLHEALIVGLKPLATQALAKGLRFEASSAPNIPARRLGDGVRFLQIVANLVTNALKFTTRGSIAIELRSPSADRIEVEIRDTGIGIPADKVDTVFEPFVQVGSDDARNQSGVGLGLAIVREIVRRMDGTIAVKSQVEQGTRITVNVRMPVAPGGGAAGPTTLWTEVVAAAPRQPSSGRSFSILICEDHVMNQKVLTAMLRGLGHRAKVTANGVEALEALARDRYDLLITDLEMPTMDGLELTRRIRAREATENGPRLPVIGATAHVGAESKHRLLDAGIDAHLPKPFSLHDLSSTIALVMGSASDAPAQDATAS